MFVTQGLRFGLFQTMPPLQALLLGTELTLGLQDQVCMELFPTARRSSKMLIRETTTEHPWN